MFYKIIILLIMIQSQLSTSPDGSDNIKWKDFLDEKRNINIPIDPAINNTVHRVNAVHTTFQNYVGSFKNNTELPFNLLIDSREYALKDINSTIAMGNDVIFEAHLTFQSRKTNILSISVKLMCWFSEFQYHRCAAHYSGSTPPWVERIKMILAILSVVGCLILLCVLSSNKKFNAIANPVYNDQQLAQPRRIPNPANVEMIRLDSPESGYESPT